MEILNPTVSNALQFFTLPAEIIGISLAFVEIQYPQLSAILNRRWSSSMDTAPSYDIFSWWSNGKPSKNNPDNRAGIVNSRIIVVAYLILVSGVLWVSLRAFFLALSTTPLGLNDGGILVLATIGIIWAGQFLFWGFWHKFMSKRPIGSLGLVVAGIGVIGEVYQMLVMLILTPQIGYFVILGTIFVFTLLTLLVVYPWIKRTLAS